MIDVSHGKCVGRFLRCLHTTNLFSLIRSSLIVVSSIRDLLISSKMPIDSLIYIPLFASQSKEYSELSIYSSSRANTCNWTHLYWPRWPLDVHLTTFGDRMQMTANGFKLSAMYSAACNKICSYIHCPLINDGNSFDYLSYCRGHYRLLPTRAHFVKKSHLLHSHFLSLFFNAKKNHEICFLKRQRQSDSS